jgi:S1-C subfamily serine protease
MIHFRIATLAWFSCMLAMHLASAAEARYVARFSDGSRHEGNNLVNWHETNAQPQLEGRSLWDANNPFRWLRDRTLAPGPEPSAFVELVTGDRFPGTVTVYEAVGDDYDPLPSHFLVEPTCTLRPPQEAKDSTIRIVSSSVRRIVWQRRERSRYQPGTLLMRDGRTLAYRAIRFDDGAASILTAEGNRRVPFNEIAEAHLPTTDLWQAYVQELAILSPQGNSRLYQVETTEGLRITSSKDRLAIHTQGGGNEPHRWFHGLQPAWSLDVLWVPNETIWLRQSFAPHELPLSRLPLSDVKHVAALGKTGEPLQRDRNLALEPLRSGNKEWGFGFGCTTTTDLVFELPRGVKSLKGSAGLDRMAGKGGCAKAQVLWGAKDPAMVWESPVLVGSDQAVDFGPLPCPAPSERSKLVLRADALHIGRPAGADPFEVRDFVDWLDPILELDPAVLIPEVRQQITPTQPALAQWQVDNSLNAPAKAPKFESFLDKRARSPGRFRTGVVLEQALSLTRKFSPGPRDQWLVMFVTRPLNQGNEPRLEARIEGELVGEFKVPLGEGHVRPLAVPLVGYQSAERSEIEVKLTLHSEPSSGPVEFRSLRTTEQLPTLYRVFEEESHFAAVEGKEPSLDMGDTRFGVHALKVANGSAVRLTFPRPLRVRENPKWSEYRQLRFTLRKKGKGSVLLEFEGDGDRTRIVRYGSPKGAPPEQVKAFERDLPDEWMHDLTRDLYSDFGAFDASAVTIRVPDGDYALLDHIYLAGQWNDFEFINRAPSLETVNRKRDQALVDELLKKLKPSLISIDFGDGIVGDGVITSYQGDILTAGHLVRAPNREVKITLHDGKEVKGKTRGIFRDVDIGLVQIEGQGGYPALGVNHWMELGSQQFFVGAGRKQGAKAETLEGGALDLRRNFQGTAWTTLEIPSGVTGGVLVEQNGNPVGILTRYSPFGGAEFGLTYKLNEVDGRLKNGEVWGKWKAGFGPDFAMQVETKGSGPTVTKVEAAAQASGVQAGDVIAKVDGQEVRAIEDVYRALAERDPGHEAAFELQRSGQPVTAKIKLVPRRP